jgi:phage shock protein C
MIPLYGGLKMEEKRLVRSRSNLMIGGVCGGLGAYFGIDPTLVRLFFVLLAFAEGIGFLIYFIMWIVVPREDRIEEVSFETNVRANVDEIAVRARQMGDDLQRGFSGSTQQLSVILGGALIILGVIFLLDNLNFVWFSTLRSLFWPAVLIVSGAFLLVRYARGD